MEEKIAQYNESRWTIPKKYKWLVDNPITNVSDAKFIAKKIDEFVKLHKEAQEEKDKIQRVHWKGLVPYLRFIHCLTDDDAIRSAFITSMTCINRVELCKYPLLRTDFRGSIPCDHSDVSEMWAERRKSETYFREADR